MEENLHNSISSFTFQDTKSTEKIFSLTKRIRAVAGGTSASKTISILVWLIDYCQTSTNRNQLCTVVSESFPHLSSGPITDFQNIMKDRGYWKQENWNGSKHTYTFETGNRLEFYSVDLSKAHGPRRDVLFVNEANNLPYNVVDQLIVRTRKIVWMDWNPSDEYWFYTEMLPKRSDIDFITLTYLDNTALDQITIDEIESHKGDKNWWTVYGEGKLGAIVTRIYKNWVILDELPEDARLVRRGLDYGYTNDPSAIVDVYKYNGGYIWDEVLYAKRQSNKDLATVINLQENKEVMTIADSSEPKSNDELVSLGVNVQPASKGQGSVNQGIQIVQSVQIYVTKRSVNILKEYRNYLWMSDKNGEILNEPVDRNNHAMDAGRYAMQTLGIDTGLTELEKYMMAQSRRNSGNNYAR